MPSDSNLAPAAYEDQFQENQRLRQRISELEEDLAMSDLVFDHIQNGALVTDPDGIILRFNRPYAEFLGMTPNQLVGRNVVDMVDNTRMHVVAQTGQPESMIIQRIKGK
ncbi:MAG: PAS domain-containing protein, partial [Proteobacteria bacterium]|nr:PAS domain-containing protein [Pseudomonadota bacterium]